MSLNLNLRSQLGRKLSINELDDNFSNIENAINKNAIADVAFEQYKATAGEVEARNAEERSKTPYAERLYGKTIESTEDVARRNQILDIRFLLSLIENV